MTSTIVSDILRDLNTQQQAVVYSTSRRLLCLAGPGTGKTHTIICKMLYSTEVLKVDPKKILALTFTNAAGKELESRFLKYSNSYEIPTFGTFHSFCYKVLSENYDIRKQLGYDQIPSILSEFEEKTLQTQAQMLTNVKLPKYAYKLTYNPKPSEKFEFEIFQKTIDKLLRQQNKITFDRLCYKVCELFQNNDPLIQKYFLQYSYVYVDEFQDTDQLQWEFVKSFLDRSTIILVGDVRQAIYQFRGSDSSIIKSISSDTSWSVIKLEQNYRSTPQICDYANMFSKAYRGDLPELKLITQNENGKNVEFITTSTFLSKLSDYVTIKNCALIARTNSEVKELAKLLDSENIKYSTKSKLKFNYVAAFALDTKYKHDSLIAMLSEEERSNVLLKLYLNKSFDLDSYLHQKFTDIYEQIESIQDSDEFSQIKFLYDLGDLKLYDLVDNSTNFDTGLYVGTIHSVKGLEFDKVIIYGVNSKLFRILSSEEMMNLYYVACTRAKFELIVVQNS